MNLLVLTLALATSPADAPKPVVAPTIEVREEALKLADGSVRMPPRGGVAVADGGSGSPPGAESRSQMARVRVPPRASSDRGRRLGSDSAQGLTRSRPGRWPPRFDARSCP